MTRARSILQSAWHTVNEQRSRRRFQRAHLRRITPYLREHSGKIVAGTVLMIIVSLSSLPVPYFAKILIDDVFPAKDFTRLHIITAIVVLLYIGKVGLSLIMNYMFTVLGQDVQVSIRKSLFHRMLRLPLSFFTSRQSGYLLARLYEVQGLNTFFSSSLIGLVVSAFEFLFTLAILFYMSWQLTCAALLILPLYFVVVRLMSRGLRTSSRNVMETSAQLSREMQESLSGISVVKTFGAEARETGKIHRSLTRYFQTGVVQSIVMSFSSEIVFFVGALGTTVILWYSGMEIMRDQFTVGAYVAFAGYLTRLYMPTQRFASIGIALQPALVALARVNEFFDAVSEDDDERRTVPVSHLRGDIRLEHVTFAYEKGTDVIRDATTTIAAGEKVALVGPSGAGKSTLVSLVLQLYSPDRGAIYLDGIDSSTIRLSDLRERIGIVSQDVFLFNDTIKNNILYGRPDASEDDLLRAAEAAYAHEFITGLPDQYATLVGERGAKLSAGQKQRISIARALLYNPDVLILDEATATLDALSERAVRDFVFERCADKTVIIIAHKFSTISMADKVIVLDNGIIQQEGDFETLRTSEGLFKTLHQAQKLPLA